MPKMTDKEFIRRTNLRIAKRAREREKENTFDPVRLIGDLIQCQIVAIKSQSIKSGGNDG